MGGLPIDFIYISSPSKGISDAKYHSGGLELQYEFVGGNGRRHSSVSTALSSATDDVESHLCEGGGSDCHLRQSGQRTLEQRLNEGGEGAVRMWAKEWSWREDFQCRGPEAGLPLARQTTGP